MKNKMIKDKNIFECIVKDAVSMKRDVSSTERGQGGYGSTGN